MPTISFGFNLAKVDGEGEDADPILRVGPDLGLLGALDGMGGAGGTVYETPDGPRTGAYIASRLARDVVERRLMELIEPEWNLDGPATAVELHRVLKDALVARLAELKAPPSGLRSKLVRALPTTMAVAALQRTEPGAQTYACDLFWAGDCRVYVLTPGHGITQLTVDDIRSGGDAMFNLGDDSPVSNTVSADTDFHVNHRRVELEAPFILLCATDGCFGYVRSPMHFEHLLLSTQQMATDTDGWREGLCAEITAITGDDAALALLGLGADFSGFKQLFTERATELVQRYVDPLDELDGDLARAEQQLEELRGRRRELTARLWADYKPGYEHDDGATAGGGGTKAGSAAIGPGAPDASRAGADAEVGP